MFFRFGRRKKDASDLELALQQADLALEARDFAVAEQLYRTVLAHDPKFAPAWFGCCRALIDDGRYAEARELMMQAVLALPGQAALHSYLGNLHFHQGDVAAAVQSCERALSLHPDDFPTMANLSNFLLVSGQDGRAEEIALRALAQAPEMHDVRLTLARSLENQGRMAEATSHYLACLDSGYIAPGLAFSVANLLVRQGRFDAATSLASSLVVSGRLETMQAVAIHIDIGVACHRAGRLEEAMAAFRAALELDDTQVTAQLNLGQVLQQAGQPEQALQCLQAAIKAAPDDPAAHLALGSVLSAHGKTEEAIATMRRLVGLAPDWVESHVNLAITLFNARRLDEALASADRAFEIDPQHHATLHILADILWFMGRSEEAAQQFEALLELEPASAGLHSRLGHLRLEQGNLAKALAHLEEAWRLDPDDGPALLQAASLRMKKSDFEAAAKLLGQWVERHPDDFSAHTLLGSAQAELAQFGEARASYSRALAIRPDHIDALASRGLLDLLRGDFAAGWEGYLYLTRQTGMVPLPDFGRPLWQNDADLNGRSLLLYADQGMGDAMQFVRYLEPLSRFDCRIELAVQPALVPLMKLLPWPVSVVSKNEVLPATDYHCPLGWLPRAFATRLESIPAPVPYLHAPAARQAYWQTRLARHDGPRVGLVWAGNPLFSGDRDRSVPLELVEGLFQHPRCRFHSLQKEPRSGDAQRIAMFDKVTNLGPDLQDFAETAAIIANLDLVVTVDTSVAHLAGAMGKPVWIMLPFSPDFRWLLGRSDSPWYPSARLFRQETAGDWASVVAQVQMALFREF